VRLEAGVMRVRVRVRVQLLAWFVVPVRLPVQQELMLKVKTALQPTRAAFQAWLGQLSKPSGFRGGSALQIPGSQRRRTARGRLGRGCLPVPWFRL